MRVAVLLVAILALLAVFVSANDVNEFTPSAALTMAPRSAASKLLRLKAAVTAEAEAQLAVADKEKDKDDKKDKKEGKKDKKKAEKKQKKFIENLVDATADKPVVAAGGTGGAPFSCIIETLHPTQFAVGYVAVQKKKETIIKKKKTGQWSAYLAEKPIPVVLGPNDQYYLIDHHHLSRALWESKEKYGLCTVLADWSAKSVTQFWKDMEAKKWVFMNDDDGKPVTYAQIPNHVAKLADNPYRSLAGFVRDAGGFSKTSIPFTEFFWADYFRKHIARKDVEKNFDDAVKRAMVLAKHTDAANLPGFVKA